MTEGDQQMSIQQNILLSGIIMAITIVIGIWLSQSGKPYNNFVLIIHKLIVLVNIGFAVFLFINIYKNPILHDNFTINDNSINI